MAGVLNMQKGYVFIHVPKCAGASITSALLESEHSVNFSSLSGLDKIVKEENTVSAEVVHLALHARARDIRRFLGTDIYTRLESFAVVRNPWERLRSLYHFYRTFPPSDPKHEVTRGSLSDFVLWSCENEPNTMHERLTDRSGKVIVNTILNFESLESDFQKISKMLSLNIGGLPVKNKSLNSFEKFSFHRRVIDVVQRTYERDFDLFKYPFDPPDG